MRAREEKSEDWTSLGIALKESVGGAVPTAHLASAGISRLLGSRIMGVSGVTWQSMMTETLIREMFHAHLDPHMGSRIARPAVSPDVPAFASGDVAAFAANIVILQEENTELKAEIRRNRVDATRWAQEFEKLLARQASGDAATTQAAPTTVAFSADFHRQLGRLGEHGIDLAHAGAALQVWHRICAAATPPEPLMERTADGGLRFAWSTRTSYLDIQIYPDGTLEWFFRDRETGEIDGTEEDREKDLPPAFVEHIRRIRRA